MTSPRIRIRRHLDALISEAGLPPRNVRVEFDTVDPDLYRFLSGTGMLAVCSGWMAPAIRRFGLEIVPPADLALEH